MNILRAVPLMLLPTLAYALFALPIGADGMRHALAVPAFVANMASGEGWVFTRGHLLTAFAVTCLFFEIVRSSAPKASAMVENSLSFILFAFMLAFFLLVPAFATGEFFLIMMMTALDFMAGAVVMVLTARRTVAYE